MHTDYRNHVFEYNANNNNVGWKMVSILEWHPDLTVTASVQLLTSTEGNRLRVYFTVLNSGIGPTYGSVWRDRIYLVRVNSGGTTTIQTTTHRGTLAAGSSYMTTYDSFIRRDINGNFTLQVVTDYEGRIVESNEGNNAFLYSLILPTVYSDLYLYNITTSPSQSVTGGSQVRVTWSVRNVGNGIASGGWYDLLFIDTVPRVTRNSVTLSRSRISHVLAPNDEYNQTVDIQISPTFSGNYFLVAHVDRYSGIFEDGLIQNNVMGYPLLVVAPSSPDLTVTSISYTISLSDTSQRILTVSWTVTNIGDEMESITSWRDRVYLSRYREFSRNRVTTINTREVPNQQLSYNQEYSLSSTTVLTDNIVGNYFIFVETDTSGNVFELNGEENNIGQYSEEIEIFPPPTPRLHVTIATENLPANLTSGSTFTITYSVTNEGEVAVSLSSWTDRVYLVPTQDQLSRSTILSTGIPLGGNVNNRELGVRQTYEVSLRVTPPYQLNQFMFLAVVVDINGNLGNPVTIGVNGQLHDLSPDSYLVENGLLPELTVIPSLSSTAFFGGQPVTMNYSVSNMGQTSATGVWYDAIYLSRDAALDSSDMRFISVRNPTNLGVGESYNRSVQVFIPFNLGSNEYYIFFETDTGNRQLETNEHNNVASRLISIEETVTTDLVVDRVSASPTDLRYGDGTFLMIAMKLGQYTCISQKYQMGSLIERMNTSHPDIFTRETLSPISQIRFHGIHKRYGA